MRHNTNSGGDPDSCPESQRAVAITESQTLGVTRTDRAAGPSKHAQCATQPRSTATQQEVRAARAAAWTHCGRGRRQQKSFSCWSRVSVTFQHQNPQIGLSRDCTQFGPPTDPRTDDWFRKQNKQSGSETASPSGAQLCQKPRLLIFQ